MLAAILANVLRKVLFIMLMSLMFISMINFSAGSDTINARRQEFEKIGRLADQMRATVALDSVRAAAVAKIIRIMRRYNKDQDEQLEYAIANEIYEMSVKYNNLDVDLICATITHESARSWRPDVVSPAGALGLMQIMPHTATLLCKPEGIGWTTAEEVLFDPINNIRMGCRYLSMLIDLYQVDGGLAAYNGGERQAARWLASGRDNDLLYEETRGYVPAVMKLYDTYRN